MISSTRKNLAVLVISLAFLVISLPSLVYALADPPEVFPDSIKVVTDGIRTPVGMALDSQGNYYITDPPRGGIVQLDKFGRQLQFFKTAAIPQRVAVDPQNGKIVVSQGSFVAIYNNNGVEEPNRLKNAAGTADYVFKFANGVAVHPVTHAIYVVDSAANSINKFSLDTDGIYKFASSFGSSNLNLATGITVTNESPTRVAVVDTGLGTVAFFSEDGVFDRFLCVQSAEITTPGLCHLSMPQSVAFEYEPTNPAVIKRAYVSDAYQSDVVAVDHTVFFADNNVYGKFLKAIGSYGFSKGNLVVPSGAVFDNVNGRIAVANGFGNITFFPIDRGTNPEPADSVLPIFTVTAPSQNISEPSITISGNRNDNVTLFVSSSPAAIPGPTNYQTATTWDCTITGLAEGRNDITVQGTNAAGVLQKKTVSVFYLKPATASFTIDPWPSLVNSTSYTFTGTKVSGTAIVINPAPTPADCGSAAGTTWSCQVPLSEGNNNISFTVNTSTTNVAIARDMTPPDVQLYAIAANEVDPVSTSTQVQNITGTVNEPNLDNVTVKVNDGSAQPVSVSYGAFGLEATKGVFSIPVVLSQAGENTVTIAATDKVNNVKTVIRKLSLNMAAPKVVITTPADGKATRNPSVTVSGTVGQDGSTCSINGTAATGTYPNWTGNVTLVAGQFNNIVVSCVGPGGQSSSVKRTIFHSPNVLALSVNDPVQDAATNAQAVTIQGTVDSAATTLMTTVNGVTKTIPIGTGGTFSVAADLSGAEGQYPYLITAVDGVGNTTSTSLRTLVADRTPPTLGINYSGSSSSLVVGTVEPGASVAVSGLTDPATITMGAGTFSAALNGTYDPYSLVVSATDQAGNTTTIGAGKPDGNCNASSDGLVLDDDASICLDFISGIIPPTAVQKAHCDVGPLKNGQISPDGQIDISDCIMSLRRAHSLQPHWWE